MPFTFMNNSVSATSIGNPTVAAPANMTRYAGSVTSVDDGYGTTPISLPAGMTWYYGSFNNNASAGHTQFYLGTNGYITFAAGSGGIYSSPTSGAIMANPGDNWVQSGLTNTVTTTTVHDFYTRGGSGTVYKNGSAIGTHYWMDIVCYCGGYGSTTTSRDWQMRLATWGGFQWVMTRARGNAVGSSGVVGTNGTTYSSGTTNYNQVWRSSDNGYSWTLYGTGFVSMIGPTLTKPSINGYSLSSVIDNLEFRNGVASISLGYSTAGAYNYHSQFGSGAGGNTGYGGSYYFYGGGSSAMQSIGTAILNIIVGNYGASDPRYLWLTSTSAGYIAYDLNSSGSLDLGDQTAIGNIINGSAGYTSATDAPVIRMRNLFDTARSSAYYTSLTSSFILGNVAADAIRPGYLVYATNTIQCSNSDDSLGTGVTSKKMYLYSSYVNTTLSETLGTSVSWDSHVNGAQSVNGVGTGPRGGVNP